MPENDNKKLVRVISYIDGYNLYFGLREKARIKDEKGSVRITEWQKYLWLNVVELSSSLLLPNQTLVETKYFTARIRGNPKRERRQATFLDALSTLPNLRIFFGVFQPDPRECQSCGAVAFHPQEKRTDVNIANEMLCDAIFDRFDVALLITGDSDQVPTIRTIRKIFKKKVVVALPPKRQSAHLQAVATATYRIGKSKFERSVLPATVKLPSGIEVHCPQEWQAGKDGGEAAIPN